MSLSLSLFPCSSFLRRARSLRVARASVGIEEGLRLGLRFFGKGVGQLNQKSREPPVGPRVPWIGRGGAAAATRSRRRPARCRAASARAVFVASPALSRRTVREAGAGSAGPRLTALCDPPRVHMCGVGPGEAAGTCLQLPFENTLRPWTTLRPAVRPPGLPGARGLRAGGSGGPPRARGTRHCTRSRPRDHGHVLGWIHRGAERRAEFNSPRRRK
eukprot:364923-Chlamydomonas_euryale.AAC.1